MKITFIRPDPPKETIGLQHLMIVEPLELEILATLVEKEHEVEIFDMILERESFETIITKSNPDILCFTGYITHIPAIINHCKHAKGVLPSVHTIVGGVHIEKYPEDINSDFIDYRVVRNATKTFPALISHINGTGDFPAGVLKNNEGFDDIRMPDKIEQ